MADTAETTEKAKLINDIVNMEWDFFQKTQNVGGRQTARISRLPSVSCAGASSGAGAKTRWHSTDLTSSLTGKQGSTR